jgi:hypothetical protein
MKSRVAAAMSSRQRGGTSVHSAGGGSAVRARGWSARSRKLAISGLVAPGALAVGFGWGRGAGGAAPVTRVVLTVGELSVTEVLDSWSIGSTSP